MSARITIRPFAEKDAAAVRELFITVNRLLSPPNLHDAFEAYIARALTEEIDRITAYYGERRGGFWVAVSGDDVVGTFGLETASEGAMELRRMYVEPSARRKGIARQMLLFAEDECRRRNIFRLELSTAEIQSAALALYRNAGYKLVREETADIYRATKRWVPAFAAIISRRLFVSVRPKMNLEMSAAYSSFPLKRWLDPRMTWSLSRDKLRGGDGNTMRLSTANRAKVDPRRRCHVAGSKVFQHPSQLAPVGARSARHADRGPSSSDRAGGAANTGETPSSIAYKVARNL